ncbi:MAG: hypothetical protein HZB70_02345 [Candidatus Berkelbacteria bacterium]|nr:MAG: hypothetical protein HZB70_02345 [Candidatus Berkelbacteria bacterium]QQG51848.1 MAG: hypothetical protein HY845_00650 [Candidatus Berkelbacteria bacterium]
MELNEHLDGHDNATTSMKVVLLIFALVVIGALAYFIQATYSQPDTTDYSAQKVKKSDTATTTESTSTTTTETATVSNLACGDKAYAFSLEFGDKWTGYKIKEVKPDYAIITCYVTMPTTSSDTVWTTAATDHDAKYASVFAVSVYSPAQWTASQEEANKPTEMGHNANYYWGWSQAQAIPDDLSAVYADAKNVVATFKIAP